MVTYMTKMRKKIIEYIGERSQTKAYVSMVLVIILCVTLNSCTYINKSIIPTTIIEYEIPFVQTGSRWNEISLLETDEYGRTIYSIAATGDSFNNVFSDYTKDDSNNSPVFAYLVCQKSEKDTIYCYEGLCYSYVPNFEESEFAVDKLKEDNDWNKALDEGKMTALSTDLGEVADYSISYKNDAISALEKELEREFQGYYIDDLYSCENKLYFIIREVECWIINNGGETNDFGKAYIFTYDESTGEVDYEELNDEIVSWREQISQFKNK